MNDVFLNSNAHFNVWAQASILGPAPFGQGSDSHLLHLCPKCLETAHDRPAYFGPVRC